MKFHNAQDNPTRDRGMIMLVGDPGAGKTLTAGTAPEAYFIDVEDRASHTGRPRATVTRHDYSGYEEVIHFLKVLERLEPDENGFCHIPQGNESVPAKTIVIDSIDHLQMIYWERKGEQWNKLGAYGDMKDDFVKNVILPLLNIKMNVIVICHAKTIQPDVEHEGKKKPDAPMMRPTLGFALSGSIRDVLPSYFDNIIYLINDTQTGKAKIITNKGIHDGKFIPAKDTLNVFHGETFEVKFDKNGKPVRVMEDVFNQIDASRVQAMLHEKAIADAKRNWMEKAAEVGLMTDKTNPAHLAEFKMVLGDHITKLEEDVEKHFKEGMKLISEWKPAEEVETVQEEEPKKARTKKE